jgi:vitamin B12/bleomycin/antimicrobial peptide transport system ATP-binding/permease protein
MLNREMPETTLISIGHRPGLEAFHDRVLRLVRTDAGARLIGEAAPEPLRATA